MGRPAVRADSRDRIEPMHERLTIRDRFAHRFDSGLARRLATPIDVARASVALCLCGQKYLRGLCDSAT